MALCKYYKPEMDALKVLCASFYNIPGCGAGGLLHNVLEDGNMEDENIKYCLVECTENIKQSEANVGILICYELLKMPMNERKVFDWYSNGSPLDCCGDCEKCVFLEDY